MANTFKNAGVAVGNSATTIYTAPGSTTGVIHAVYIMKTVDVPADSTLVIEKPINLEAGDILKAVASTAGDLQAFASVLEIT